GRQGLTQATLRRVWEASGHLEAFSDPLVECKKCHHRFRADHLKGNSPAGGCPDCGNKDFTEPKKFNLLVEAFLGVVEGEKTKTYLRGEITQGVHVNFKNVLDSSRVKIPFGIAQIGKAFRNEITPSQLLFRSREFEQMELQFYVKPDDKDSMGWFEFWKNERMVWYRSLGLNSARLRFKEHGKDELAHYARAAVDIEYHVEGEGWKEMEGIHHRGDWDLRRHGEFSGTDLSYFDEEEKQKYIPWVIETSGGVDRAALFLLMDAYHEEEVKGEKRVVLKLNFAVAPYKIAVFPLLANKPDLVALAAKIRDALKTRWMVAWDDRGNIGKRYRAQDEIGTPYCVTVDFDSLENPPAGGDVTVRDRDTMMQERVKIKNLPDYFEKKLGI
ncbi:MAG: glycine--tRNA ligase, partial [Patescibacteria group bacterium]